MLYKVVKLNINRLKGNKMNIKANYNVNVQSPKFNNQNFASNPQRVQRPDISPLKEAEINLDKAPSVVIGRVLVVSNPIKDENKNSEKPDIKVIDFGFVPNTRDVVSEYSDYQIQQGYEYGAAEDKAFVFAQCIKSNENL